MRAEQAGNGCHPAEASSVNAITGRPDCSFASLALLHQYQRKHVTQEGEACVLATPEDVHRTNQLAQRTLGACRAELLPQTRFRNSGITVGLVRQELIDQVNERHALIIRGARGAAGLQIIFHPHVLGQGRLAVGADVVPLAPDFLAPLATPVVVPQRERGSLAGGLAARGAACRMSRCRAS
ncbi:MAG: hypothetical protein ACQESR_14735 [Planctomycetota bacterium]